VPEVSAPVETIMDRCV